ncbi:MAG: arsenic efflux protein [Atopobiaceae bacterium]|jgi:hypothetical protein|nr:arsenic efflux protein [Atopobiaceae bacterium]MCI2173958.1 arsenic efflux protein [Atopobiaceae bacterium]MCI2207952.1 arsenic efflux protein [Atopobiaceae bacterium]
MLTDVLLDGLTDTIRLVPFLFVTYLAMEALEHGTEGLSERVVSGAGHAGPIVGALLGAVPQCGFSAMAATLFSGRVITLGTLVAVILSTSDEMLPVFIANQAPLGTLAAIVLSKVVLGMVCGLLIDMGLRAAHRAGDGHVHIHELCDRAHCHCDDDAREEGCPGVVDADPVIADADPSVSRAPCADDVHDATRSHHHGRVWSIVRSALVHTLQVSAFILVISILLDLVMELVGTDAIGALVSAHPVRAILVSALVGLIPNCGASVAISQLYLTGTLGAGAMMAGLLVSGGVGLLVLFRTNADARENVAIVGLLYVIGVVVGLAITVLGITF